jgi:hypothetical protein
VKCQDDHTIIPRVDDGVYQAAIISTSPNGARSIFSLSTGMSQQKLIIEPIDWSTDYEQP